MAPMMAGDDDADRVGTVGKAHGSDCGGAADACGEFAVGGSGAAGDLTEGAPDFALEGRAGGLDREGVDCGEVAGEVAGESG